VPRLARANRPKRALRGRRPPLGDVIRAALIAIQAVARKLRQDLAEDLRSMPAPMSLEGHLVEEPAHCTYR
jgi:hypothetical protein